MKVNVKNTVQNYLFDDIETGEVFCDEANPNTFLLRTDLDEWVAVDIETGVAYNYEDFNLDARYRIVNAEVTIS